MAGKPCEVGTGVPRPKYRPISTPTYFAHPCAVGRTSECRRALALARACCKSEASTLQVPTNIPSRRATVELAHVVYSLSPSTFNGLVCAHLDLFDAVPHDIMDHLHLNDPPPPPQGPQGPPGGPMLGRPPPPPQQLPAQMFTTAAQLLDLTDSKTTLWRRAPLQRKELTRASEKLMLVLRDGRKLMGVLRSWDQFGMASLQSGTTLKWIGVNPAKPTWFCRQQWRGYSWPPRQFPQHTQTVSRREDSTQTYHGACF